MTNEHHWPRLSSPSQRSSSPPSPDTDPRFSSVCSTCSGNEIGSSAQSIPDHAMRLISLLHVRPLCHTHRLPHAHTRRLTWFSRAVIWKFSSISCTISRCLLFIASMSSAICWSVHNTHKHIDSHTQNIILVASTDNMPSRVTPAASGQPCEYEEEHNTVSDRVFIVSACPLTEQLDTALSHRAEIKSQFHRKLVWSHTYVLY